MSQTDPRAVAKELSKKLRDAVMRAPIDIDAAEAMEIPLLHALADAERRGLERAVKVAEQMKIQTCAIRNETAIIHELLLKVESRIEKVATLEKQIRAQAQADKEG